MGWKAVFSRPPGEVPPDKEGKTQTHWITKWQSNSTNVLREGYRYPFIVHFLRSKSC